MKKNVLILGASGRFGRHAATAFSWAGWSVTRFDRATDKLPDAAWGADVIVNAWNPAYPDWAKQVPALTRTIIATAKDTGATVIFPGNVYSYGRNMPETLDEATPHEATAGLPLIRKEMEQAYRDAGIRTIVLRAGDYIDTEASGNWFDAVITKGLAKGTLTYPGRTEIDHAWAFLPDLAEAAVALAERRHTLAMFEDVSFDGFTMSGRDLQHRLSRILGREIKLKTMPWWPIRLAVPFWKMGRHLLEMRYLWNTPHRIVSRKFGELVPDFKPTQIDEALLASLPKDISPNQKVAGPLRIGLERRTIDAAVPHRQAG